MLPSEQIKKIAQDCLDGIYKYRAKEEQEIIDRERQKVQRSWTHKLFKTRIPSDEEIRQDMMNEDFVFREIPSRYAWGSENIAKKLIQLANQADQVFVSAEDLDYIL
jgi:hypothetical protein